MTNDLENTRLVGEIYDIIKNIRDPEKPESLEDLEVINEKDISIEQSLDFCNVKVVLTPTVPHCSLAAMIGLCVRVKLERCWNKRFKLDIYLKEGSHTSVSEINKQLNDKERVAAAMENPNLKVMVEECIRED